MFNSILTSASSGLTLIQIGLCFLASIACGLIIAVSYKLVNHASKSFITTLTILPSIVMGIIIMVNGNLGIGVAVAGSFSLVRFRSLPGKASDIAILFLAMATGLATGMGYLTFALLMAIVVSFVNIFLTKATFFDENENYRELKITIPEDLDYAYIFDDILKVYTKSFHLTGVKTVNLGTMFLLSYDVELKDVEKEKQMIDELRCRNGNLTISSLLQSSNTTEL